MQSAKTEAGLCECVLLVSCIDISLAKKRRRGRGVTQCAHHEKYQRRDQSSNPMKSNILFSCYPSKETTNQGPGFDSSLHSARIELKKIEFS